MVEAMIKAHTTDPEFYEALFSEVPHRADGTLDFSVRLHGVFRLALAAKAEFRKRRNLDRAVFVVANMIDSLAHAALLRRPRGVSLSAAKEEAVRAILAYLRA
jgi:Tetracyclin repressor-like, C-terminal domain